MADWNDATHALGVAEMDATHAEFVALVNRLVASDAANFAGLFVTLLGHCRQHFTNEGRLMRISRVPALAEHEAEHHRIYGDLVQMNRAVQRGRLVLPRAFEREGLVEWFGLHLASMDVALAAHLLRTGAAPRWLEGGLPILGQDTA